MPGRHLNALLTAEAVVGVAIDERAIDLHAQAAFYSCSGAIPLPLNRPLEDGRPVGKPVRFTEHNTREGLHAMYALARYRQNQQAEAQLQRMIAFINKHYLPQMAWDDAVMDNSEVSGQQDSLIHGLARSIGPLVKYYNFSGYQPALELALQLALKAAEHYPEDGRFDQALMGTNHVHSISSVLSSLAQLAQTTQDERLMARVRAFFDNGLQELRNELGWSPESADKLSPPVRGEINTTGDMVETALILGKFYGAQYYDDAERILRGHLLPSQLRDSSFIQNPDNPLNEDRLDRVAQRHLGAFGFPAPYGHHPKGEHSNINFNTDIVGGAVGSLCEAYAACTAYEEGVHRINLLFDHSTDALTVTSPYSPEGFTVTLHKPGTLLVRIPSWARRESLNVPDHAWHIEGDYLSVPDLPAGEKLCICMPLVMQDIVLHHQTHELRARLLGDTVLAMDNEGMDMTFFPAYE